MSDELIWKGVEPHPFLDDSFAIWLTGPGRRFQLDQRVFEDPEDLILRFAAFDEEVLSRLEELDKDVESIAPEEKDEEPFSDNQQKELIDLLNRSQTVLDKENPTFLRQFTTDTARSQDIVKLVQRDDLLKFAKDRGGEDKLATPNLGRLLVEEQSEPQNIEAAVWPIPLRAVSVAQGFDGIVPGYDPAEGLVGKEKIVVTGIIDDSINVALDRFIGSNGQTRVDYCWIQDAVNTQTSVPYGREVTRSEIDAAIAANGSDEKQTFIDLELMGTPGAAYRPSPVWRRSSHGTHVGDLATGYEPSTGDIRSRIVGVQLPALASQDTSGITLMGAVTAAIQYTFDRAFEMSKALNVPIPVVINFSYAFHNGPHDGNFELERAMRVLAKQYRTRLKAELGKRAAVDFVVPTGNSALSQTHAHTDMFEKDDRGTLPVTLQLQPDDQTSSFVEFWMPRTAQNVMADILGTSLDFNLFQHYDLFLNGQFVASARLEVRDKNKRMLLSIAPTKVHSDTVGAEAPHGEWPINVSADLPKGGRIKAWVLRDENVSGFPKLGRQAYFRDAQYRDTWWDARGDVQIADVSASTVQRNGTVSGIATRKSNNLDTGGIRKITVGAYVWSSKSAASYSGAGADDDNEWMTWPDYMAVSDTSFARGGIFAAGTRSGSVVAQNGTSVAAPQVARYLVEGYLSGPKPHLNSNGGGRFEPVNPVTTTEQVRETPVRESRLRAGYLVLPPNSAPTDKRNNLLITRGSVRSL